MTYYIIQIQPQDYNKKNKTIWELKTHEKADLYQGLKFNHNFGTL